MRIGRKVFAWKFVKTLTTMFPEKNGSFDTKDKDVVYGKETFRTDSIISSSIFIRPAFPVYLCP